MKNATINTIDGKIDVFTTDAKIMATSSNGNVVTDKFSKANSVWKLKSINGDITVVKQE